MGRQIRRTAKEGMEVNGRGWKDGNSVRKAKEWMEESGEGGTIARPVIRRVT